MLLVASAPLCPYRSSHLGKSGRLSFAVHAKERDAASAQLLEVDLIPFVTGSAAYGATALTTGHQSMIVCGVYTVRFSAATYGLLGCTRCMVVSDGVMKTCAGYLPSDSCWLHDQYCRPFVIYDRFSHVDLVQPAFTFLYGWIADSLLCVVLRHTLQTPQGWTVNFDCSTYSDDSWGLLVPQLKETLKKWPFLSAASSAVVDPKEMVSRTMLVCRHAAYARQ